MSSNLSDDLRSGALVYHRRCRALENSKSRRPNRWATSATCALAYSPGVAAACEAIVRDPAMAAELTARANLVAVVAERHAPCSASAISGRSPASR